MKVLKILLIIFISLTNSIKAKSKDLPIEILKEEGKLIFIRHAYAPGNGDPNNFNLDDCSTQRNLNEKGKRQSKKIGIFFKENLVPISKILSSEWCRCKETANLAFGTYEEKSFLNSFYDEKLKKNKKIQMKELKRYIKEWNGKKNLVLITHYVVMSEILNFYPASGEIVISDKNYNVLSSLEIKY
jgi:phosphohistidine phosphatase SixA